MAKRKSNSINRKKRREESKKIESVDNFDTDIMSKVFTALCVVVFFFGFYLLTLYITNKNTEKTEEEKEEVTVSNENIILGRSLSMSDGEYFVIYYDKGDSEIASIYSSIVSSYKAKGDSRKIYTVDMSNGFNKKYLTTEESNKTPQSAEDFKINGPTLILVNNHTVVDYIEGEDSIRDYLS